MYAISVFVKIEDDSIRFASSILKLSRYSVIVIPSAERNFERRWDWLVLQCEAISPVEKFLSKLECIKSVARVITASLCVFKEYFLKSSRYKLSI